MARFYFLSVLANIFAGLTPAGIAQGITLFGGMFPTAG
jgi:hypothetical protein